MRDDASFANKAAWLLLALSAAYQVYDGLSSAAYVFMGVSKAGSGVGGWTEAAFGALQAIAGMAAFVFVVRRDLRGATLAVAGCILLGWLATAPSVLQQGLNFRAPGGFSSAYFVVSPVIAFASAALAWRNSYPLLAAFIATAPILVGILFTMAFAVIIATHGF